MEEIRTRYVEDANREARIKHWESTLSNALQAVHVAQQTLDKLYRERYEVYTREIGQTALTEVVPEQTV